MNFLTEKMKELAEKRKEEFRRIELEMQELRHGIEVETLESEAIPEIEDAEKLEKLEKLNRILGQLSK